ARQHEDLPVMLVTALDIHDLKHTTAVVLASLLDIARAEESPLEVRREPVSLSRIVAPLVTARVAAAQARCCYIATDLDAESTAPLDHDLVSRIVENALDNALRYTPVDGCAQLRIGNTGKPIPVEARLSIFEKYDQAERKDDRGSNRGLGLYFGRLAAEAHGGKIWVEEEAEMPTVFVVSLPAEIIQ
ncbi:MAG: ATP-binding protein, partial [Polyangia bacterium]